jgi:hypothetical protein
VLASFQEAAMRLLFLPVLLLSTAAAAQPRTAVVPENSAMQQMVRASGMIFSGVVIQIQRVPTQGIAQIALRVEDAIRGVRRGQVVQVSEWIGLWNSGDRYLKGEHVMLFLYPKSKLGLTSPVGGRAGRYSISSARQVLVASPQQGTRPVSLKTFKAQIRRAVQE